MPPPKLGQKAIHKLGTGIRKYDYNYMSNGWTHHHKQPQEDQIETSNEWNERFNYSPTLRGIPNERKAIEREGEEPSNKKGEHGERAFVAAGRKVSGSRGFEKRLLRDSC